ncbi:glycosyltransferase [candidate division KSB1 bacterium]|nr:glycosyltransferase [candidate division KSB1 bacterium]
MRSKVALIINTVTIGGRLATIVDIVQVLNNLGIVPHIYALRWNVSPEKINRHYGRRIQFTGLKVRIPFLGFYDVKVSLLNLWFRLFRQKKYHMLINCNNSLLWLPKKIKIFTYMYFSRKSRLRINQVSIHIPRKLPKYLMVYRFLLRQLYKFDRRYPNNTVFAISNYCRQELKKVNPEIQECGIIYPGNLEKIDMPNNNRKNQVVSIGRFSDIKRQFDQILIAEKIPDVPFKIIGAVRDKKSRSVYEKCMNYIAQKSLDNVELLPNATQEQKEKLLKESSFFLHTTMNEPFGIVTVEAMAAGCIPVVHDSGGTREIVTIENLRFNECYEAADILARLLSKDLSALRVEMAERAKQFTADIFREQMKKVLTNLI